MKKNTRVLITGGAGFIGSNLARSLVRKGYEVTVLDNLSKQIHGDKAMSPLYKSIKGLVRFVEGDVRKKKDWLKVLPGQDVIVHYAAETGTGQSMYQMDKYVDVNVRGTAILADLLANRKYSVKKVVVASSRAVYGEGKYKCKKHGTVFPATRTSPDMANKIFDPRCPICHVPAMTQPTDELSMLTPLSVYAMTKRMQEELLTVVCRTADIPLAIFRYQNAFGPGQSLSNPYTGILSIFSGCIKNMQAINIFEDGKESRDFVYIDDVVAATVLGIKSNFKDIRTYNVGSGVAIDVLRVAKSLCRLYRKEVPITVSGNFRIGDIRHNTADLLKIRNELGFYPKYDFMKGLRKFVAWVNTQKVSPSKYGHSLNELRTVGLLK
ncbi:MAG: epimerase [Elusimicrobia bacterium GWD2_63_28]|nr:MAG: epimerase [Elusimicrobia bacterium GWD2_63_28]